jgi:hypothetical protein
MSHPRLLPSAIAVLFAQAAARSIAVLEIGWSCTSLPLKFQAAAASSLPAANQPHPVHRPVQASRLSNTLVFTITWAALPKKMGSEP